VEHGQELLELRARFLPFVLVEKDLRALLLQLYAGIRIFLAQGAGDLRQRGAGGLGFVGLRIFVIERLIVLRRAGQLPGRFVCLCALEKERGLGGGGGVGLEGIDGRLRVAGVRSSRRESFEKLLLDCGVGVIALDGLQRGERVGVALEQAEGLRGPIQNMIAQQGVTLGFSKPSQRLLRVVFVVVVVTQSQRGARSPNVRGVLGGKGRQFCVAVGRGVVQRARQTGKLFLRGFVLGTTRRYFRAGRVRSTSRAAGDGLGLVGFFLLVVGRLRQRVERRGAEQHERKDHRQDAG
jgi:hypothetical protein